MKWKKEYRPCPVCASDERVILGRRGGDAHRDKLGIETRIAKCRICTTIYAYPTLVPIGNPYSGKDEYFVKQDTSERESAGALCIEKAEGILGRKGRMLDLGCGRGEMLRAGMKRGWSVQGVEMTEDFIASDLPVEISRIETCEALNDTYDFILLSVILEHVYEPVPVLRRLANALKPGGLLFIEVPNERSLAMNVGNIYVKPKGWSINLSPSFEPYHVVGYSPKALEFLIRRIGLDIHEMRTVPYIVTLPGGGLKRDAERFTMKTLHKVGGLIGKGDGLELWARKP
jgi:SAM-dependent methyltransferase